MWMLAIPVDCGVVAGTAASAVGSVGTAVIGNYGSITINADGSYSYTVDNSNAAVQALRTTANTLQDVFTYTMVDSGGLTSTTQITLTIQGANDNPVAVSDSTVAVEAGGYGNGTSGSNPTGMFWPTIPMWTQVIARRSVEW